MSRSHKLKSRNMQELRMQTVQLEQESLHMEQRLRQLQQNMSREKEERAKLGTSRWKSSRAGSVPAVSLRQPKDKETTFQKLSAGKMKVKILKDEQEDLQDRPVSKHPRLPLSVQTPSGRPRLTGKACGQCEARTAGIMCVECGEDYCIGCFAKFHQKGALKHHRMVPIQMEIQTSISAQDIVKHFRRNIDPEGYAVAEEQALKQSKVTKEQPQAQVFIINDKGNGKLHGDGRHSPDLRHPSSTLLKGKFDEEESAQSFQEALHEWRQMGRAAEEQKETWRPAEALPVTREDTTTQASLMPRQHRPVVVEFRVHSLSYMEKLFLKKHRNAPIEEPQLAPTRNAQKPSVDGSSLTDEDSLSLTAEEKEIKKYYASVFAPAAAPGKTCQPKHLIKPYPTTMALDEETETLASGITNICVAEQRTGKNKNAEGTPTTFLQLTQFHTGGSEVQEGTYTVSPENPTISAVQFQTNLSSVDLGPFTNHNTSSVHTFENDVLHTRYVSQSPELGFVPRTVESKSTEFNLSSIAHNSKVLEPRLSPRTKVTEASDHSLSNENQIIQALKPDLTSPGLDYWSLSTAMTSQTSELQTSLPYNMVYSPELPQKVESGLSIGSQLIQPLKSKTTLADAHLVQSLESRQLSMSHFSDTLEKNPLFGSNEVYSSEHGLRCLVPMDKSSQFDFISMTQKVESPELRCSSSQNQQSLQYVLSTAGQWKKPLETDPENHPSSKLANSPGLLSENVPRMQFSQSSLHCVAPTIERTLSPEHCISPGQAIQSLKSDLSLSGTQSPQPRLYSKSQMIKSPRSSVSLGRQPPSLTRSLSPRVLAVKSSDVDLLSRVQVLQSENPDLLDTTQDARPSNVDSHCRIHLVSSPKIDPTSPMQVEQSMDPDALAETQMVLSLSDWRSYRAHRIELNESRLQSLSSTIQLISSAELGLSSPKPAQHNYIKSSSGVNSKGIHITQMPELDISTTIQSSPTLEQQDLPSRVKQSSLLPGKSVTPHISSSHGSRCGTEVTEPIMNCTESALSDLLLPRPPLACRPHTPPSRQLSKLMSLRRLSVSSSLGDVSDDGGFQVSGASSQDMEKSCSSSKQRPEVGQGTSTLYTDLDLEHTSQDQAEQALNASMSHTSSCPVTPECDAGDKNHVSGVSNPHFIRPTSTEGRPKESLQSWTSQELEIQRFESLCSMDSLQEEEDNFTLDGLEEELKQMNHTQGSGLNFCDQLPHDHHATLEVGASYERLEDNEGHSDDEEEIDWDRRSVMELP